MRVRWSSAWHVVAKILKFLNVQKKFSKVSRLVTTTVSRISWRVRANYASPCRFDRFRVTKMAWLDTPYCGSLWEQNSCQTASVRLALHWHFLLLWDFRIHPGVVVFHWRTASTNASGVKVSKSSTGCSRGRHRFFDHAGFLSELLHISSNVFHRCIYTPFYTVF